LSHERLNIAGAEPLLSVEGIMCGAVMRGAVALPGSKATSRTKGSRRNLGGLTPDHRPTGRPGPHAEGEEPTRMMNGREKSDSAIVAAKQANKAGRPAAEPVERRAGAKGRAVQQRAFRTLRRVSLRHRGWIVDGRSANDLPPINPRQEPYAGKPQVRICAGGGQ